MPTIYLQAPAPDKEQVTLAWYGNRTTTKRKYLMHIYNISNMSFTASAKAIVAALLWEPPELANQLKS